MSDNPSFVLYAVDDVRYEQRPVPERGSRIPPLSPCTQTKVHSSRPRRRRSPGQEDWSVPQSLPCPDLTYSD
jgi:hypothetical protein